MRGWSCHDNSMNCFCSEVGRTSEQNGSDTQSSGLCQHGRVCSRFYLLHPLLPIACLSKKMWSTQIYGNNLLMQVPLMLKHFCIMLLYLVIPTQKAVLKWIILAWNIFAWVCAMTDHLLSSSCLPQPQPPQQSGCDWSCCTRNGRASEGACLCLSTAGNSVAGTVCQQLLGSEYKRTEVLKPSLQPQALRLLERQQLLPRQPGPWRLWDRHRPPHWNCTMDFSSSGWSGKSPAACGVPSASSCWCFPPVQVLHLWCP